MSRVSAIIANCWAKAQRSELERRERVLAEARESERKAARALIESMKFSGTDETYQFARNGTWTLDLAAAHYAWADRVDKLEQALAAWRKRR